MALEGTGSSGVGINGPRFNNVGNQGAQVRNVDTDEQKDGNPGEESNEPTAIRPVSDASETEA